MSTSSITIQVVSGLIVRGDRMLLTQRRATDRAYPSMWETPGGKKKEVEKPTEALRRELEEEIGLKAERIERISWSPIFHTRFEAGRPFTHAVVIGFFVVRPTDDFVPLLLEVEGAGWFTLEQAKKLDVLPGNVRLFENLERVGFP